MATRKFHNTIDREDSARFMKKGMNKVEGTAITELLEKEDAE